MMHVQYGGAANVASSENLNVPHLIRTNRRYPKDNRMDIAIEHEGEGQMRSRGGCSALSNMKIYFSSAAHRPLR
jgi:hypothetical protein